MKIEINNRWSGEIIIAGEYENIKDCLQKNSDANLSDAYLLGANLSDANLSDANLRDANLLGANLSDAYLLGANLLGANLSDADLRGANLGCANLGGADLRGANLSDANLRDANLRDAYLRGAIGIAKNKVQPLRLLLDQPGQIRLYKLVTDDYMSPMQISGRLRYPIGATVEAKANADDTRLCDAGINVATLDWCMKEWITGWRILVVEFTVADIACIPIASDGKIRLHRCTVVGEKDLVEIGMVEAPVETEVSK